MNSRNYSGNRDLAAFFDFLKSIPRKGIEAHHIYVFLFWISGVSLTVSVINLSYYEIIVSGNVKNLSYLLFAFIFIVSVFSLYHQWKVYKGLTVIYNNVEYWRYYTAGFVGGRIDIFLRVSMLLAVLTAFSKMEFLYPLINSVWSGAKSIAPSHIVGELSLGKTEIYVFWVSILFLLMSIWSISALLFISHRDKNLRSRSDPYIGCSLALKERNKYRTSLWAWVFTDLLATSVWFSLCLFVTFHLSADYTAIVLIFGFLYISLISIRFIFPSLAERIHPHGQNFLSDIFQWMR